MNLRLTPTRLISEVQDDFNRAFPFLKLEFYQKPAKQPVSGPGNKTTHTQRIGDCQSRITDGILEISKEMKVKQLEKGLSDQFGLTAQVFRQSGNLWLQTTMTDEWTLEKQNEHGMELSGFRKTTETTVEKNKADDTLNPVKH